MFYIIIYITMAEWPTHERVAKNLAKKFNADYNSTKGVDIVTNRMAIEVETTQTIGEASKQLAGFKKPVYIAATSSQWVKKALEKTEWTTIWVMDAEGNIIKRSTR